MMRKKKWWKSKTLWVNTALAIGTVVEANFGLIQSQLRPQLYLAGMAAVAGINFALRFVTTEPIVDKKP